MKNNDLIIKLKKLQSFQPDEKFLKDNRELLLSQISNTGNEEITAWEKVLITSENLFRLFSRPVFATGVFVLALLSAVGLSQGYLEKSKPNDSLYLARVISEQVKVKTTFDAKEREKLAINFALRHAEDLATILSDEQFSSNEDNMDQIAKYSDSFMTEVNKVESRLTRLNTSASLSSSSNNVEVENVETIEAPLLIADDSKKDEGLEIFINEEEESESDMSATSTEDLATSSAENLEDKEMIIETQSVKELVEKKDFSGAVNKLNEAVEAKFK